MTFPSRTTSLASIAAAAAASAAAFPFLPRRVATHFTADGQPDRYGSRASVALTLPVTMGGIEVVNDLLGAWPGGSDRDDRQSGVQARNEAIGLTELALLTSHLAVLARDVGLPVDMSRLSRAVFGGLMIGLGNVMPKLPRNGLVGIRTPWTLANPAVWERTHRLGGYLLMGAGLVSLATLPLSGKRAARLPTAVALIAVVISAAYSYVDFTRRAHSSQ